MSLLLQVDLVQAGGRLVGEVAGVCKQVRGVGGAAGVRPVVGGSAVPRRWRGWGSELGRRCGGTRERDGERGDALCAGTGTRLTTRLESLQRGLR